jgi:four helix bundle protein
MENEKIYKSFTDLGVWKIARQYKIAIFELSKDFPSEEKYRLVDQIIRSSRSIGDNISEGYGRYTYKDQLHFCMQARGSLNETLNHLINAYDCKYISDETLITFKDKTFELEKLLNGYIAWLKKQ